MKKRPAEKGRLGHMGILGKTASFSWLVTLVTVLVFIAVILPGQK